jgi:hypothetical protein
MRKMVTGLTILASDGEKLALSRGRTGDKLSPY